MTASTAEHFDFIKMLLRSKSLDIQGFSAAGYWNARRVLTPSRTPATLFSVREASFFDSLKNPCPKEQGFFHFQWSLQASISAVVIDETAIGDDVPLGIGQCADRHGEGENAAVLLHGVGGNIIRPFQHRLPQPGDKHIVP